MPTPTDHPLHRRSDDLLLHHQALLPRVIMTPRGSRLPSAQGRHRSSCSLNGEVRRPLHARGPRLPSKGARNHRMWKGVEADAVEGDVVRRRRQIHPGDSMTSADMRSLAYKKFITIQVLDEER